MAICDERLTCHNVPSFFLFQGSMVKSLIIVVALCSLSAFAQDPRPRGTNSSGTVIGGGRGTTPVPGPAPMPGPAEYRYDCKVVMVKNEIYGRKRTLFTYMGILDASGTCHEALLRCRSEIVSEKVAEASCWQVLEHIHI